MSIEGRWKEEAQTSLEKFDNAMEVEIAHDFILGYVEGRRDGKKELDEAHEMFKAVTLRNSKSLSGQLVGIITEVNTLKSIIRDNELMVKNAVIYLSEHTEFTLAAKTLSILLGGDFRDAKSTAEKYLQENSI